MKKRPLDRTKVVWRHLAPSITQAFLAEQIDNVFSGRYRWVSFRPGKSSQKRYTFSRAYIKFKRLEDVTEFAWFFNGHVFMNKKDPEYIEFLKLLVKPVESLPSAEIQLERREAVGSGAAEGVPIVTMPLIDYVRRKRASKRRTSTTTCVLTDMARKSCRIEKATCNLIAKVEKLELSNKSNTLGPTFPAELLGGDSGVAGFDNCRNKKIQLSKRKVFGGIAPRLFQEKHMTVPSAEKHDHRSEKCNLVNQDVHKYLPQIHLGNEKRPPGDPLVQPSVKDANNASDVVFENDLLDLGDEKLETRIR
ncbi:hypothetical protein NL676_039688 [Syzygium grande]|nr:hypothetical protein NL676_039688 [Syzygium grande]